MNIIKSSFFFKLSYTINLLTTISIYILRKIKLTKISTLPFLIVVEI